MNEPPTHRAMSAAFVSVIAHPAAVVDVAGRIQSWNDDFLRCVGLSAKQVRGHQIEAVFHPEDQSAVAESISKACCGRNSVRISVTMPSGTFKMKLDSVGENEEEGAYLCQLTPDHAIDSSRLRFLLEHLDQGVWNYNVVTQMFTVTDAWRRMRGIAPDVDINARASRRADWMRDVHPEDRDELSRMFYGQTKGGKHSINVQYRRKHTDGRWIWILCRANVMSVDQNGVPVQIVGLDTDITDIKENEAQMTQLAGKMQLAIDVAGIGVWEFDTATKTVHWDDRLLEIYGLNDETNSRAGNLWETYLHPDDRDEAVAAADLSLLENRDFVGDYRIIRPTGEVRHLRSLARFVDVAGTAGKMLGVNIDITDDVHRTEELERARLRLEHDSRHDALTGLANRRLLDEVTASLVASLAADDQFAVLHLDLDHFKQINDTLGHSAGDAVLVHVAQTLRALVGEAGLVCRIGGDEFVVLLQKVASHHDVRSLCQMIINQVARPKLLQGETCKIGLSIGCALGDGRAKDAAEVFINADVALYAAKSDGRSCFRVFKPGMRPVSQLEASARQSLQMALSEGQITCFLQPQFDAKSKQMIGAEALVRWNCPERGILRPDQFMPTAEKAGLVPRIDEYVFDQVLAQQTVWARAGLDVPVISLNISLDRLQEEGLVQDVAKALAPHHAISFELLETAFLDDSDTALAMTLDGLRCAGVRLELDDFGSGHSSIVALQAVRPDRVKIDRRLVAPLSRNKTQIQTLHALVRLARLEGCDVVIEGVETHQQVEAVAQLDCAVLQGFALAHPMSIEDFSKRFMARKGAMSW